MKILIEIPDGEKVGVYVKNQLIQNNILNPDGSLKEDLEVRVFYREMVPKVLSMGTDMKDFATWAWPYYPDKWEYNNATADHLSPHPGAFAFYKKNGLEYVEGTPGKRRFIRPPYESLIAVFKYKDKTRKNQGEAE
ncbi:MAG: hypothetical protein PHH54_06440 [Candidatus Nanoarchaeia archaeon]|nr:hypothetical protein [Candidatus Nanoarchaeia archaeon]MDD5741594.1 hypothetical protein [Candidatus Nanoarchaeia archaeon]